MKYIYELIKKYASLLAEREPAGLDGARLFVRAGEDVFAVRRGADVRSLRHGDIEKLTAPLPFLGGELTAAVYAELPSCAQFAAGDDKALPASLEDMAQIIGPCASVVDTAVGVSAEAGSAAVSRALAESSGCFLRGGAAIEKICGTGTGALTVGRNLYEAVVAMCVLEKAAEAEIMAKKLGGSKPLPAEAAAALRKKYIDSYSREEAAARTSELQTLAAEDKSAADYAAESACKAGGGNSSAAKAMSPKEQHLRAELTECGKKLAACGLVQGTWGNLSLRLDEDFMLVTPTGLDYMRLTPCDMVKVPIYANRKQADAQQAYNTRKPTSEKDLHGEIYKIRKDVNAVIHTHSRCVGVFAIAEAEMPVLPSYAKILGSSVALSQYGAPGSLTLAKNAAAALKDGSSVSAVMPHHGAVACGRDLGEAFAVCAALEENARKALAQGGNFGR